MTVLPDSDDSERFVAGRRFVTHLGRELIIRSVKPYRDKGLLIRFEGVSSRKAVESLRGHLLTVDREERRDLATGEFWPEQLEGLAAVTPAGELLGTVERVEFGPGQDRLVVTTPDGKEVLVPFVSEVVGDPEDGTIVIDAPEGLF